MGILDGKVALITGAGRGIGREHALMMASEGAKVVVNDLGGDTAGGGADATPAQEVVAEIEAMGGEAVVNGGNVAKFDEAEAMIQQAVDTFGDINIVVNNAGILRDRMLFSMSEDDWDAVIAVHLKGTYAPSHHAAKYWREKAKAGEDVYGRIINTASPSGIYGNVGQTLGGVVAAHQVGGHARPGGGSQTVDGHAVLDQFLGCDDREGGDAGLGRAVIGLADVAVDARG